jgi:hypothetical protein
MTDAKLYSGWVQNVVGFELSLECPEAKDCLAGDRFYVHAFGPKLSAVFDAELLLSSESSIMLRIEPPVRYVPATEDARVRLKGVSVIAASGARIWRGEVVDASRRGLGLLCPVRLLPGERIAMEVHTDQGAFRAKGEIRYCRQDPSHEALFRVGIRLEPLDRLSQVKWHRALSDVAA